MKNKALKINTNEIELKIKDGPVPKALIMNPDTAGPINLAELKLTARKLIALAISSGGTICVTNDCAIGASIELEIPRSKAITYTCQICTFPEITNTPRISAHKATVKLAIINNFHFGNRSASFPPKLEKNMNGIACNPVTIPN
jgi:hypothetical protein